ncbi:hypothetical protein HKX48_008242 [Thoreauomyces humboldtii]|nr:hypothetical protein HKX48_008242 [Thoreauomyces humboldtii]
MSEYDSYSQHPTGPGIPSSGAGPYSVPPNISHAGTLKSPPTILRAVEWLLALVCFSGTAAFGTHSSGAAKFLVFVGVMGWLFASAFLAIYFIRPPSLNGRAFLYAETAISGLWTLFFFCGSVALAVASCGDKCGDKGLGVAFG